MIATWDSASLSITDERRNLIPGTSLDAHGLADVVHFGRFGGIWSQGLWCVFGLTPAILAFTGILMWWNRVLSRRFMKTS